MSIWLWTLLASPTALAQDASEPAPALAQEEDDEFDFLNTEETEPEDKPSSDDFNLFEEEDDDFPMFEPAPPIGEPVVAPSIDLSSWRPLADVFPLQVGTPGRGAIEVELQVLVALAPEDLSDETWWLIGEVYQSGERLTELRQEISPAMLIVDGPTLASFKARVPEGGGPVEIRVAKELDGQREELFRRGQE